MVFFEMKRLFSNKVLYMSMFMSTLLGLIGLYFYYEDINWHIAVGRSDAVSAYDAWLYCLGVAPGSLLILIFPLLIAIPFCDSFLKDQKSNYISFIISRGKPKNYLLAKYVACGTAGSVIMGGTLMILFIICLILFPSNIPNTELNLKPSGIFSSFYKNSPNLYVAIILAINMIFGFIYSVLGIAASSWVKNRFAVTAFPFIFYLGLLLFSQLFRIKPLFPLGLIAPFETGSTGLTEYVVGYLTVLIVISIFSYRLFRKAKEGFLDLQ